MKTSEQTTSKNFTTVKELNPARLPAFEGFFYPASIWLDKHLNPVAKNLLVEISLLEQRPLGCIASNEHFAATLNISKRSAARYISELVKDNYLILSGFDGHHRQLRVNFSRLEPRQFGKVEGQTGKVQGQFGEVQTTPPCQKEPPTMPTCPHNGISNESTNNISIEEKGLLEKEKATVPPKKKQAPKTAEVKAAKKPTPKKTSLASKVKLPFASDTFKQAWGDWLKYRAEIKKPYKSMLSVQRILDKLAGFEEAFALELIGKSIANGWQGLVFAKTGEQYQEWLTAKRKKTQGTGTRAQPQPDLMNVTRQTTSICHQLSALEAQQANFKDYPAHTLAVLHGQLQSLWRKARQLQMFGSEIYRITALGNEVKQLINNQDKSN
ncbi:helix-turn-helix domain-containing protein [Microscilla marina]|uniref:Gp26 n=1 Tax=Microscilla marina ATCC 23134 TaxID=313606 RepID=A1ZEM5_MICM2|nr:helix-turn-helix domain-containing protein [Microscilla marina]EAY30977.1 gp26 [Microscilla marina ATCC 23134]